MFHRTTTTLRRVLPLFTLLLIAIPVSYFLSFAPVFVYLNNAQSTGPTIDRVMSLYRPLFRVVPEHLMQNYVEVCGATDTEAFFFVQAMKMPPPIDNARIQTDLSFDHLHEATTDKP
jgi:hypothetical protein